MWESRRFTLLLPVFACFLILLPSAGSGDDKGGGVAPSISNLSIGPTSLFLLQRGGSADVTVSMDWADPDGDLAFVQKSFRRCGQGPVQHQDIAPMGITGKQGGAIWLSAAVPTDCPVGTYRFEFSAFDRKGHQSNTLDATITLKTLGELLE